MNFVQFTTRSGQNYNVPIEFPAELDPRFDFVKSDSDLIEIARKRIELAAQELAEVSVETGPSLRADHFSIVTMNREEVEFVADPPRIEKGA